MQEWHQPTYQRGYLGNRGTAPRRYNSRHGFTRGSKSNRGYRGNRGTAPRRYNSRHGFTRGSKSNRGYRGNRGTAPRRYNSRHGFTRGSKSNRGYNNSDFRSANREYASASSIMMSHSRVTKSARLHIQRKQRAVLGTRRYRTLDCGHKLQLYQPRKLYGRNSNMCNVLRYGMHLFYSSCPY